MFQIELLSCGRGCRSKQSEPETSPFGDCFNRVKFDYFCPIFLPYISLMAKKEEAGKQVAEMSYRYDVI